MVYGPRSMVCVYGLCLWSMVWGVGWGGVLRARDRDRDRDREPLALLWPRQAIFINRPPRQRHDGSPKLSCVQESQNRPKLLRMEKMRSSFDAPGARNYVCETGSKRAWPHNCPLSNNNNNNNNNTE